MAAERHSPGGPSSINFSRRHRHRCSAEAWMKGAKRPRRATTSRPSINTYCVRRRRARGIGGVQLPLLRARSNWCWLVQSAALGFCCQTRIIRGQAIRRCRRSSAGRRSHRGGASPWRRRRGRHEAARGRQGGGLHIQPCTLCATLLLQATAAAALASYCFADGAEQRGEAAGRAHRAHTLRFASAVIVALRCWRSYELLRLER